MSLVIVPTTRDEACAFIERHHRHHRRPAGYLFAVAVAREDGEVCGVATIGRPVARHLQDGWTCEVTRSCTDGTPHANSALYGAAWRAAKALGYRRCLTYTHHGETGASLRGAGWRVVAELEPRGGWDMPGRRRADKHPTRVGRTRWEITASAAPWEYPPRVDVLADDAPTLWGAS